jgi:hypothetical protein
VGRVAEHRGEAEGNGKAEVAVVEAVFHALIVLPGANGVNP